jgi:hypothetical protein
MLSITKDEIFSNSITTITILISDEFNNQVPVFDPVRIVFTAESGKFALNRGTMTETADYRDTPCNFTLTSSRTDIFYQGIKKGNIDINCQSAGLESGRGIITVLASTTTPSVKTEVKRVMYVPSNVSIKTSFVDSNDNEITGMDGSVMTTVTDSAGEIVFSSNVKLVNGSSRVTLYIDQPGVYTANGTKFYALIDKNSDAVIKTRTGFGNVKFILPKNTIDRDVVIELQQLAARGSSGGMAALAINKPLLDNTLIDIVIKDSTGNVITESMSFAAGKTGTLIIPYPDTDQDGIVDGTIVNEHDLRVCRYIGGVYQLLPDNVQVDTDRNTVSVTVNQFGAYAVMSIGSDPVIDSPVVYPNPFFDSGTKISFNMGSPGEIKLDIYTVTGRLVRTMSKTVAQPGYVEFNYDGTDSQGGQISNGTYIYKIKTNNNNKTYIKTGKLSRLK